MHFDLTDEQRTIQRTARELLEARSSLVLAARAHDDPGAAVDDALWPEMAALGWSGIAIDEAYGGQGLGILELTLIAEELGYGLAPVPLVSNALAGIAIAAAGTDEQRERWLPGIASGEHLGAFGIPDAVPYAAGAEVIVLYADRGLWLVPGPEAQITPRPTVDATLPTDRVQWPAGEPLEGDVELAIAQTTAVSAGELLGVAQRALDLSVAYAKERRQFDRPIAAHQAVSHRLAEMFLDVETMRSAAYYAAWAGDARPPTLSLAALIAKAELAERAVAVTQSAIQVHGGVGFTWEHPCHLLLKRALLDAQLVGGSSYGYRQIAELAWSW